MAKFSFFIIFAFYFNSATIIFGENETIKPWIALSTIWGQGGLGVQVKKESHVYDTRYHFVANWLEKDFSYHEISQSIRYDKLGLGIRYRHQLSQDEFSPFISYFYPFNNDFLPISVYNDVEYRINSVIKDSNYFRSRHILTLYASDAFKDKYFLRPYVALDSFVDWNSKDYEKLRFNVGYFIDFKKATARVYFIPWSDGVQEEEWDDKSSFGASLIYKW